MAARRAAGRPDWRRDRVARAGGAQLADEPVKITFENVTEALGLEGLHGDEACWIDYNNDGWTDLQGGGSGAGQIFNLITVME